MKLLKFIDAADEPVYINPAFVVSVAPATEWVTTGEKEGRLEIRSGCACIYTYGEGFDVKGTPEEISARLGWRHNCGL